MQPVVSNLVDYHTPATKNHARQLSPHTCCLSVVEAPRDISLLFDTPRSLVIGHCVSDGKTMLVGELTDALSPIKH